MHPGVWVLVIIVSAGVAYFVTRPIEKKLAALENLCEMLSRAIRGDFDKK